MHYLEHKNREILADWLTKNGQFNVFATVTLKQAIVRDDGIRQFVSREECSKTSCFLRDRVSNKVIGRTRYKKGERLDWAPVIESGFGEKRFHLHLMIGKPDEIPHEEFEQKFRDVCDQSIWVYRQIDIQEIRDIKGNGCRAVAFYSLKEGIDALDLRSSFLRNHQVG